MRYIRNRFQYLKESKVNIEIPQEVRELHKVFSNNGYKLYLVGGCVRDAITGEEPKDFDMVSDASYSEMKRILEDKYRLNHQGKSFGVIAIFQHGKEDIEIAVFQARKDGETQFGVSMEEDAQRRDLTFNALYYDIESNEVIDLVGGVDDLKNGVVRMVGEADDRIDEDPLRILRVLRFATRYGFEISPDLKDAIKRNSNMLKMPRPERPNGVSQERIWEEFTKAHKNAINSNKDFKRYIDMVSEFDLWEQMFTGINVDDNYVETKHVEILAAQLLRKEEVDGLTDRMGEWDMTIPRTIRNQVKFLIDLLQNLEVRTAPRLENDKRRFNISDELLKEWYRVNHLTDKMYIKFLEYAPSVNAHELMKQGFKNEELGKEIARKKIEQFEALI